MRCPWFIYIYIYKYNLFSLPLHPTCLFCFIYPLDLKKSCYIFSSYFWFTPETEKQDGNKFIILN